MIKAVIRFIGRTFFSNTAFYPGTLCRALLGWAYEPDYPTWNFEVDTPPTCCFRVIGNGVVRLHHREGCDQKCFDRIHCDEDYNEQG